jgi:phage tail tape-measure protein
MNLFRTIIQFTGVDKLTPVVAKITKELDKTEKQAKKTTGSFKDLAGAFTTLVVAAKVKGALQSLIEPAIKMEFSMKRLKVLVNDTSVSMAQFERVARDAAEATVFGPQQAVDALVALQRATSDADTSMGLLKSTLGLAQASFGRLVPEEAARRVL